MAGDKKENLHAGHRARMREKYLRVGFDGFAEHEILEMLLYYCIPQKNTNELAETLIRSFGSFSGVLSAPVNELCTIKGVGERTAILLRLVGEIIIRETTYSKQKIKLNTTDKIGKFVKPLLENSKTECVIALALDEELNVIRSIKVFEGSFDSSGLPIPKFVRMLVNCGAAAVVIAHNHPSGYAFPSVNDIRATSTLKTALDYVGIQLIDHIIVVPNDYVSFRESGNQLYTITE